MVKRFLGNTVGAEAMIGFERRAGGSVMPSPHFLLELLLLDYSHVLSPFGTVWRCGWDK